MITMNTLFKNTVVVLFLIFSFSLANKPLYFLKEGESKLKKINQDFIQKKSLIKRDSNIKIVVNDLFDFAYMGKKALGKKICASLSSKQKQKFFKIFPQVILKKSVEQFSDYKSDSVFYDEPKFLKKETQVSIETRNYYDGEETVLKYKMYLTKNKQWKVWDLITDDLSTYRSYKEQFKRILSKNDFDYLLDVLEKKL